MPKRKAPVPPKEATPPAPAPVTLPAPAPTPNINPPAPAPAQVEPFWWDLVRVTTTMLLELVCEYLRSLFGGGGPPPASAQAMVHPPVNNETGDEPRE